MKPQMGPKRKGLNLGKLDFEHKRQNRLLLLEKFSTYRQGRVRQGPVPDLST